MKSVNSAQWIVNSLKKGFTLLEFTVVIGLLMLAIGSTLAVLLNTLKGSNQANVTTEVKQNGQAILDSFERQIRGATGVECTNTGGTMIVVCDAVDVSTLHIKLLRQNQTPLHIKCFAPTAADNGYIGTVVSSLDNPSDNVYIAVSNTDPVAGVDITSCSMVGTKATSGGSSSAAVTLDLTINQGVQAASRQDFKAKVQFKTTISLRQY